MTNPFEKRATEYLRDDSAFLSIITPDPLHTFFEKHAKSGALYDRLCMVVGTPGSGKTTIARLMQYQTAHTLVGSPNHGEYAPLHLALTDCGIINNNIVRVLGCRVPMESEYREFWELPYEKEIRFGLLRSFLQARAIILWLNGLSSAGAYDLSDVRVIYREGSVVAEESLGGYEASKVLEKAKQVEKTIYSITAALVPPEIQDLPSMATDPYHPFDSISGFEVSDRPGNRRVLNPLVMLDDVHTLHPDQLLQMSDWLSKREIAISRWIMMRLDAQTPEEVLDESLGEASYPSGDSTVQKSRDITRIWLQNQQGRGANRRNFRTMAKNMAEKYLRLMPVFPRRGLKSLGDLLNTQPPTLSPSNIRKLRDKVDGLQRRYGVSSDIRARFEKDIDDYMSGSNEEIGGDDLKLAILAILFSRYVKRVPQSGLFDEDIPVEPSKPIKVDSGVADGAKIHLLHDFKRPYYYGIDAICDSSSENAEQFLQFAGKLVDASQTRIIRNQQAQLSSRYQHQLLVTKSEEMVRDWNFPRHQEVKKLCDRIATQCIEKSLEPNAPLGGGANAFGIPDADFDRLPIKQRELAQVLKFGVAYNAITIKRHHSTKNRLWTLIELAGPSLVSKGLTFTRGGFLERNVSDLTNALESS